MVTARLLLGVSADEAGGRRGVDAEVIEAVGEVDRDGRRATDVRHTDLLL